MNLLAKKARKVLLQFECLTWWEKLRTFSYSWVMIGQTFSYYTSTLFIWCCRVCYFAWWTRVSWGHHATLVYNEKMEVLERLCLRALKSLIWPCLSAFIFKFYLRQIKAEKSLSYIICKFWEPFSLTTTVHKASYH